ncbi:glycoside hydrolase [Ruminococcaceae bacterium OttesenSCG-928-L11]|nr:glycoside hydrolase [Ruminococcaceae bacterium OttesenSCG-928-L11]
MDIIDRHLAAIRAELTLPLPDGRVLAVLEQAPPHGDEGWGGDLFFTFRSGETEQSRPSPLHRDAVRCRLAPDRLLRLSTGRILLPVHCYPRDIEADDPAAVGHCVCFFSDDDGASWDCSNRLTGLNALGRLADPMAVELEGGALKLFLRTGRGYLYESISTDGGKIWQGELETPVRMPNTPFAVKRDPVTGWVFLAWINAFPGARKDMYPATPLCLGVSRDNTDTWEPVRELAADPFACYSDPVLSFSGDAVTVDFRQAVDKTRTYAEPGEERRVSLPRSALTVQTREARPLFAEHALPQPDNQPLLARYITGRGCTQVTFCDWEEEVLLLSMSRPGGYMSCTWDGGHRIAFPWRVGDSEPSSLIPVRDGLMMLLWDETPQSVIDAGLNGSTYSVAFSRDGGRTWGKRRCINPEEGCYYVMNDRFIRLSTGRICLAIALHPKEAYSKGIETAGLCACYYSDDEGQTWRSSNWIGASDPVGHLAEPMIVELADGTLKMFMRNITGYLHVSISTDRGETWQPEQATAIRMPCSPFAVKRDPESGWLFLVWDRGFAGAVYQYPRSSLWMAVSKDGGESWLPILELEANPDFNYGYPALYFNREEIWVSYYINDRGRGFSSQNNRCFFKRFHRGNLTYTVEKEEKLI